MPPVVSRTQGDTAVITDLHCHFFPAEAIARAGLGTVEPRGGNRLRLTTATLDTELEAGLVDLERHAADMRRQGVAHRAISVPPFLLQYQLPPAAGAAWARAVNDGIAAAIAGREEHFSGLATLPLQDVPAALRELERAVGELGLRGVEIATNIAGVELDDERLEPFWALVERLEAPVLVHPHDVVGTGRMGDYYLRNLVGNPVETALAGARLLFGGVLERHPGLMVILSHGGGALPQLVGRLRHGWEVRPEATLRAERPLEGLRQLFYDTVVFDAAVLRHIVAVAGVAQVVVGTDYPFDMGETDPLGFVRGALPADQAEEVARRGAALLGR